MIVYKAIKIRNEVFATRREAERNAVRECLLALGLDDTYSHTSDGRPHLPENNDMDISVSHSRSVAVVAVAPISDGLFGIDIEEINRPLLQKVAPRILSKEELAGILHASDITAFARAWTAKEAVFKAARLQGIDFREDIRIDPVSFAYADLVRDSGRFYLTFVDMEESNLLCIAARYNNLQIKAL